MTNDNIKEFIRILSRYVEVSHVYYLRIKREIDYYSGSPKLDDRHSKLLNILENRKIPKDKASIAPMNEKDGKGQSVIPTTESFAQVKIYQEIVKEFLDDNKFGQPQLRNKDKIYASLNATPQEFLGSFSTVSYAWDVLTELACLSFLPSPEKLTSRDLVHMHSVELTEHITRLYVQMMRMKCDNEINLSGRFTVKELENFQRKNTLVDKILSSSSQRTVRELVDELCLLFKDEIAIIQIIKPMIEPVLSRLTQVENGFPDMLEEDISIDEAQRICNDMVSFGISLGYATWLFFSKDEQIPRGMLIKHCLFCTRYLLDEQRWAVCKNVSNICKQIIYSINTHTSESDKHNKAYMVEANHFFSRKMLSENIASEVQAWDISSVHERYKLLQLVLLGKIDDDMVSLAKKLLNPESNGIPNMSIHEFTEWPILESFRKSVYWDNFETYAKSLNK